MASKTIASISLFLLVNLILFNFTAATSGTCPRDTLQIQACADVLNLININLNSGTVLKPCCDLISGLIDVDAAICLCTSLKLSVLGTSLNIPLYLTLALSTCHRSLPQGFRCP